MIRLLLKIKPIFFYFVLRKYGRFAGGGGYAINRYEYQIFHSYLIVFGVLLQFGVKHVRCSYTIGYFTLNFLTFGIIRNNIFVRNVDNFQRGKLTIIIFYGRGGAEQRKTTDAIDEINRDAGYQSLGQVSAVVDSFSDNYQ